MPFDLHANLAISAVAVAPSPPESGLTLEVLPGQGARFYAAPPFNITLWPSGTFPTAANAEVARVIARAGDVFTLERNAEPPGPAKPVVVGYMVAETITVKALQDIESGTNFPRITTGGPVTAPLGQFTSLGTTPLDAANLFGTVADARLTPNVLTHAGGYPGGVTTFLRADGTFSTASGGVPGLHAPTHVAGGTDPVSVTTLAGYPGGTTNFLRADGTFAAPPAVAPLAHRLTHETGGSDALTALSGAVLTTGTVADARLTVNVLKFTGGYPGGSANFLRADGVFAPPPGGGGVSPHAATHEPGGSDPLANVAWTNVANTFNQTQTISGSLALSGGVRANTTDGADTSVITVTGGGLANVTRGAVVSVCGNEAPTTAGVSAPASVLVNAGQNGSTQFLMSGTQRGVMHSSGGFSWGSTTDPGAGNFSAGAGRFHASANFTTGGPAVELSNNAGLSYVNSYNRDAGAYALLQIGGSEIRFRTGIDAGRIHPSGGFSWGSTTDPGAGNISTGHLRATLSGRFEGAWPPPGATGPGLELGYNGTSCGVVAYNRSAATYVPLVFDGSSHAFWANGAQRGVMHTSGGFSWGSTTDPGANNFRVGSASGGNITIDGPSAQNVGPTLSLAVNGGEIAHLGRTGATLGGVNDGVCLMGLAANGIELAAFHPSGMISFRTGGAGVRGMMHASGGFSWGSTTDPGANNLTVTTGVLRVDGSSSNFAMQITATSQAGYFLDVNNGQGRCLVGVEQYNSGVLGLPANAAVICGPNLQGLAVAATHASGAIAFHTGGTARRGLIFPSGGFCWGGGSTDPGAGFFLVGTSATTGNVGTQLAPGGIQLANPGTGTVYPIIFYNSNGTVGSIQTSGAATGYNTASDARLKTDRGRLTDTRVLRDTIIHAFDWAADGTPGRGVFAQEAVTVAPFAVSVGTDERDDEGRLTQPWGVDYAKFVPDLIVGWQAHEARLAALEAQLATLLQRN